MTQGTIGIISGELARYATFTYDVARLAYECVGLLAGPPMWQRGADICANRNRVVMGSAGEWIFWLDDDHRAGPEVVRTLVNKMEAHELDILSAFVCRRQPPFKPVVSLPDPAAEHGLRDPRLEELPAPHVIPDGVWHLPLGSTVGGAGVVVRRRVYDALAWPWYEGYKLDPGLLMEDTYFAVKAGEKGFRVGIDLKTPLWHTHLHHARPSYSRDDGWGVEIDFEGTDPTKPWVQRFGYEPPDA